VGTDPQPAFRRIYSPARHQERFDPDNHYVRRYVRELRTVPERYIREPWTMPADVQQQIGCVIGEDYPAPVVEQTLAREEALERYRSVGSERG
jgi:deoxyribodipyrimidine photo-lyase